MLGKPSLVALWAILFNEHRYLKLCSLAVPTDEMHNHVRRRNSFRKHFGWSLVMLSGCIALALLWAGLAGQFATGPQYEIKPSKVMGVAGNSLLAWGTWFMLGDPKATFDGNNPDELLRTFLFKILFVPGLVLTIAGGLWADIP